MNHVCQTAAETEAEICPFPGQSAMGPKAWTVIFAGFPQILGDSFLA
jgi:hypothetical protein